MASEVLIGWLESGIKHLRNTIHVKDHGYMDLAVVLHLSSVGIIQSISYGTLCQLDPPAVSLYMALLPRSDSIYASIYRSPP